MPIYEYECRDCKNISEFLIRESFSEELKCQRCESSNLKKLISAFSISNSKVSTSSCTSCTTKTCATCR